MGSNLLIILPGATTSGGVRMGGGTQSTLNLSDAEAIVKECPAVAEVAPSMGGVAQIIYGHLNWSTGINGTTPGMLIVRDWELSAGRSFTQQDVKNATKVALLGQTVVDNLFGEQSPVGQTIRIKNVPFTVIGVLAPKGQNAQGTDQDDTIMIPVTTAQKKLFGTQFPGMVRIIMVKAKSSEDLADAEKQITELLRQRHHIGQRQDVDFSVRNLTQIMQAREESTRVMTMLLGAIASVSLLVGGIGIMNIMLVSVTERTREIGIRMAIGAKTWDITAPVHHRGAYAVDDRRHHRDHRGGLDVRDPFKPVGLAHGRLTRIHCPGVRFFRLHRHLLRVLSRLQGLAPESHRCAAV